METNTTSSPYWEGSELMICSPFILLTILSLFDPHRASTQQRHLRSNGARGRHNVRVQKHALFRKVE